MEACTLMLLTLILLAALGCLVAADVNSAGLVFKPSEGHNPDALRAGSWGEDPGTLRVIGPMRF